MRVLKTKWFVRFARKQGITDAALRDAVKRAAMGLLDADLGGGLVKQRVARPGEGRSGGYRTLIVYRAGTHAFFVYGFAKNELDNIDAHELRALREAAVTYQSLDSGALASLVKDGRLIEVSYDE
jgi:hypothetical protein